ncbi:aminoglycoside phosphotransferase (APT) family kinase protein [Catenulispora sp. EB89]|uniref:phosphotransferase n=1 Tax=Catenulispora sp. EB89 TaxID=3156257 RepID=UPI00351871F8
MTETDTDTGLVGRLLAEQFPQWADLAIRRVESTGTDNAMFRLGGELCVRLPRIDGAVDSLRREQRWLPRLAARVPLAVPVALAVGELGDPAVDLLPAWNLFEGEARAAFRAALGVDDDTWERGRGWALSIALVALPYYTRLGTNPRIVADSWHDIDALLKDA